MFKSQKLNRLDYIPLDPQELDQVSRVVIRGNILLHRLYRKANKAVTQSIQDFVKREKSGMLEDGEERPEQIANLQQFRKELLTKLGGKVLPVLCYGEQVSEKDVAAILAGEALQGKLLHGFEANAAKLAWKYCRFTTQTLQDLYDEAIGALIKAAFTYRKRKVKFITYGTWVIRNTLINVIKNDKQLCPWTNTDIKLYVQYVEAGWKWPHDSFDTIVRRLKFNKEQLYNLGCMLNKVTREGDWQTQDGAAEGQTLDNYTTSRSNRPLLEVDEREAIENLQLSEFEEAVLDAYIDGNYGWKSEVAREWINPSTGKPFSRQSSANVLVSIRQRLAAKKVA